MPVDEMGESGSRVIAAVDLGSNSFHMIVGELRHGQLTIIDRLRETVRLSEGLRTNGDLVEPARSRALDCLSRFGERIHDMQAESVRAAGTSSLRRARDSKNFREDAENALGRNGVLVGFVKMACVGQVIANVRCDSRSGIEFQARVLQAMYQDAA